MLFGKDAQQAADQALILRRVTELALNPGMNIQDGMLTTHLRAHVSRARGRAAPRVSSARPTTSIDCPTPAQRELFGPKRRRVPQMIDLKNPVLLGPVQNQEHHMNGVVARRNNFNEPILPFLEEAYDEFGELTGRHYGLLTEYKTEDADTVFVSLGCAAENIEAACDYLREQRGAKVGSIHVNVHPPLPRSGHHQRAARQEERHHPRAHRRAAGRRQPAGARHPRRRSARRCRREVRRRLPALTPDQMPRLFRGVYGIGSRDFRPEHILGAYEFATGTTRAQGRQERGRRQTSFMVLGVDHPYAVSREDTPSLLPEGAIAVRFHSIGGWGMITTGKNLGAIIGDFDDLALRARQRRRRVRQPEGNHSRHGEPEVRVREEGRADDLLHGRGAGADPGELRAEPRGRRALLRPEGVHAHQPARRHGRGRLPRLGIRAKTPRDGVAAHPG